MVSAMGCIMRPTVVNTTRKSKCCKTAGGICMKATGIVRRIDELGRVVIPKEIRRTQHIREGDPLEIFINADGDVIFKKYSPLGEWMTAVQHAAQALSKSVGQGILICDREQTLACEGVGAKEMQDRRISKALMRCMEERKSGMLDDETLYACEGCSQPVAAIAPILVHGDLLGAVLVLQTQSPTQQQESLLAQITLTANFLAKSME